MVCHVSSAQLQAEKAARAEAEGEISALGNRVQQLELRLSQSASSELQV